MKRNKNLFLMLNVIYFILFLLFSYVFFVSLVKMELSVSSQSITELKLFYLKLRKILVVPVSFFFSCIINFNFVDEVIKRIKLKNCSKKIFGIFCFLYFISIVILNYFCKSYRLI